MPKGIPKNGINAGWFKNGLTSWNKGKKMPPNIGFLAGENNIAKRPEIRSKISAALKGRKVKPFTLEHKKNLSLAIRNSPRRSHEWRKRMSERAIARQMNVGRKPSEETRQKMSVAQKGKIFTEEHRRKLGDVHRGEKHHNWQGGMSYNPYPLEFNKKLKLKIRARDNFVCCLCGRTEKEELEELNRVLSINHIDFNKNNCTEDNLNTLCVRCNIRINKEREKWSNYFVMHRPKLIA